MRICHFGTYDRDYCRNEIVQRGLALAGAEVVECHATVWDARDKSQVRGARRIVGTARRFVRSRGELRREYRDLPEHDALLVGYLGHLDVALARRLAGRRPVVLDAFLSLHETVVEDRAMVGPRHPVARVLWRVERGAYRRADLVLLDTETHADFVAEQFGLDRARVVAVPVGADDRVFAPPEGPDLRGEKRRVLFYGKFIPLHGVETIIAAADILAAERDIEFRLIGTGQTYAAARALADERRLNGIDWVDWVDYEALPGEIAAADVCLGVFSPHGKALRVIPNKVYQALACGGQVITADTPAMRELGDMGEALTLVPPGDAEALAEAIRAACAARRPLRRSPGCEAFLPASIGRRVVEAIGQVVGK